MLELKVIGCYGAKKKGKNLSAYLIDENLALDSGSICSLSKKQQEKVSSMLITHSHLDHWSDLPFFAYNNNRKKTQTIVYSTKKVIDSIIEFGFSQPVWVPFHNFENEGGIRFEEIPLEKDIKIKNYEIKAIPVKHNEGVGYLVSKEISIFYTGDTGSLNKEFWKKLRKVSNLKAVIIECSFPNEQSDLAFRYNHLSPEILKTQIEALARNDVLFLTTHFLPEYEERIKKQLKAIRESGKNVSWFEQGKSYIFQ